MRTYSSTLRLLKLLRSLASWLLLVYLSVLVMLFVFQHRLLYPAGGPVYVATPDELGMDWQAITLSTTDEVTLAAWWLPRDNARATLLFFHGNAGNISHRLASISQFQRLGLSVFIIDYRGYGRSEGRSSEAGTALDARAAWQWLQEQGHDDVIIFGRSLGAAVAVELAREVSPLAVIVESPFRSVPDLAASLYPLFPVRRLLRYHYPLIDQVSGIDVPVLVIHSREDEIIPFSEGTAVFEAANEPKRFLAIEGGHNDGFLRSATQYEVSVNEFLEDHVDGR